MRVLMRRHVYLAGVFATILVACGSLTPTLSRVSTVPTGTYRGVGTGAGLESLTALATRFQAQHPGVTFKLEDVGADTSVALVANGAADFGFGEITNWAEVGGQPGDIRPLVRESGSS